MYKLKFENWIDARWVISCAMGAIEKVYTKDSKRYKEMETLYKNLNEQMIKQVGEEYNT